MGSDPRLLVERYKFVGTERIRERGALQFEKILNDDYVKFLAKSEDWLIETGTGILGLITNHAYLDNPTMRGLRHSLSDSFEGAFFFDLAGSAKKVAGVEGENVFDIQQGVAICVALKCKLQAKIYRHAKLLGNREAKYETLGQSTIANTAWSELSPTAPYYLFVPTDYALRSEYERFVPLTQVFSLHSIGLFTSKDHFVISRDPQVLAYNAKAFRDSKLPDEELCKKFEINPKEAWDISKSRKQLQMLSDGEISRKILRFTHRPFDSKYIFFDGSLVWSMAGPVNRNLASGGNLALVTSRQLATPSWAHAFCAKGVVEMFLMSNKTKEGNHVFPLYLLANGEHGQRQLGARGKRPNLNGEFLKRLSARLSLSQGGEFGLPEDVSVEDIFNYVYRVFHSAASRSRYGEFLKIDFPRLPLPGSLELFRRLGRLGNELVALHLLESLKLDNPIAKYDGPATPEVERVSYFADTIWLDKARGRGFRGVPEVVWTFYIGAYQVCEKWLKDRKGRKLLKTDIEHYQRIVVAVAETIRLMKQIDEVVDKHGGWPGAFSTERVESSVLNAADA
jgi:predicted helicase